MAAKFDAKNPETGEFPACPWPDGSQLFWQNEENVTQYQAGGFNVGACLHLKL